MKWMKWLSGVVSLGMLVMMGCNDSDPVSSTSEENSLVPAAKLTRSGRAGGSAEAPRGGGTIEGDLPATGGLTVSANRVGGRAEGLLASRPPRPEPEPQTGDEMTVDLPGGAKMKLVWIEPGTFTMGSPDSEEGRNGDEGPQHQVEISQGFYLGKFEITQAQWESVMGANPSSNQGDNLPVEQISWEDVQGFIGKLNEAAEGSPYRLPREAEWEYACRAGTQTRWSFGDEESQLGAHAWFDDNSDFTTHEVGTKLANPWGLFDMHGNVFEWCQDWFGAYESASQVDPTGPETGSSRVIRGGGFHFTARDVRSASRNRVGPGNRNFNLGARLLRMK